MACPTRLTNDQYLEGKVQIGGCSAQSCQGAPRQPPTTNNEKGKCVAQFSGESFFGGELTGGIGILPGGGFDKAAQTR